MMVHRPGFDGWRFLARGRTSPALEAVPVLITTALSIASDEWVASNAFNEWLGAVDAVC
jgi:hypothetical protein